MCASTCSSRAPRTSRSPSSWCAREPLFDQSREQFHQFLTVQASIRGLPAVMMLDKDVGIIDQADTQITQAAFLKPSPEVLAAVNDTEPQVAMFLDSGYVAAIIKLRNYGDTYLYIARLLDPRVLAQLRAMRRRGRRVRRSRGSAGSASRSPSR